jgi:hypothetical protein
MQWCQLRRCSRGGEDATKKATEVAAEAHAAKHPRGGVTRSVATARGGAKRDVNDRGRPSNDDANNYGGTNIRVGQTKATTEQKLLHNTNTYNSRHNYSRYRGGAQPRTARGGCINEAFRKEMTPADANFVETVTQRKFHSITKAPQPPPTRRANDDASRKVVTQARHRRQPKA